MLALRTRTPLPVSAVRLPNAVILLFMAGGPSHLDTFDPKPDASSSVRSRFRAISTAIPGLMISESLPLTAKQMGKVTLFRGISHGEGIHTRAQYLVQTGRIPDASFHLPVRKIPYVSKKRVPESVFLLPPVEGAAVSEGLVLPNPFQHQPAIMSNEIRGALRLDRELTTLRTSYGENSFGQSCLIARRLVELGVRKITITMHGWDTHSDMNSRFAYLLPQLDSGFSTLLTDLQQRGLLHSTRVIWAGEFGRSPLINRLGGRDHWPAAMCAAAAGGGVEGGQVVGSTCKDGSVPNDESISIEKLSALMA